MTYDLAEQFVHGLNLKSEKEWRIYCKAGMKPDSIPTTPARVYKSEGWVSMGKWLGTDYVSGSKRNYLNFTEAQKFVQKLNLKSETQWRLYSRSGNKPSNIPSKPDRYYKNEWVSWGNWLGTKSIANSKIRFVAVDDAKTIIRKFKISSFQEWKQLIKTKEFDSLNIPKNPPRSYTSDWKSWEDFFGSSYSPKQNIWPSYDELKKEVRKTKINSGEMYRKVKNKEWPTHPDRVYNEKWKGWADFLGKK
jgi:hypothetical protein